MSEVSLVRQKDKISDQFKLLFELCKLDMKQRTAGTAFGVIWIYLNPAISMMIIWFVFHFGIRGSTGAQGIYSLLVGLMSWQLVTDTILTGTGAYIEKPYLVKKIKFPLSFLPLIKVINSFWIHLPFLATIILISVTSGRFSTIGLIEYLVFFPILFCFLTLIVFLFSTVAVFYRDLPSVLGLIMQLMFWATPIIWTIPETPKFIGLIEKFNPFFFIISVYRYSFLGHEFDFGPSLLTFGLIFLLLGLFTRKVYMYLRSQFADVL